MISHIVFKLNYSTFNFINISKETFNFNAKKKMKLNNINAKNLFILSIILQINILFISDEQQFYILSDSAKKGAALTSFTDS